MGKNDFEYDVALSYATENRDYVDQVAGALTEAGVRVFYDRANEAGLWGKDLYEHLDRVYRQSARFCVVFISEQYAKKMWPTHERQSAQARALQEHREYILPARFDDTPLPGLRETIKYINLRMTPPDKLVQLILEKLEPRPRANIFPRDPDILYERLGATSVADKRRIYSQARNFFGVLGQMTEDERKSVTSAFAHGCPAELPENVHINIDLLRRLAGFSRDEVVGLMGAVDSLGFTSFIRDDPHHEGLGEPEMLVVTWDNLKADDPGGATETVMAMIDLAGDGYCEEHGSKALMNLDFSQLSTASASPLVRSRFLARRKAEATKDKSEETHRSANQQ